MKIMYKRWVLLIILICYSHFLQSVWAQVGERKIVLIAGKKSHDPGEHEYEKTVFLIKALLNQSNVKGIRTEVHTGGWPINEHTLENASLILFVTDGRDGDLFEDVPFMTPDRIKVVERQMKRGCGLSLIHFSNFSDDHYGRYLLEWTGGYFDWQDEQGKRNWYSALKTMETTVALGDPSFPVLSGVKPFRLKEEFYYNIRFNPTDKRLKPLVFVPELESNDHPWGNVVAWAVQRKDGGRGFSTTMGHYFKNLELADYRKLLLNGIVWAAGAVVPKGGVETSLSTAQ